jgi:acyl carrier protein
MAADTTSEKRLSDDPELRAQVLRPYRSYTSYLKSADVTVTEIPADRGGLSARCEFEIPHSCYIDDTGHFNSVELNICYNQMLYYVLAEAIRSGLLTSFRTWTLEDYWRRQLPDVLITDFRSAFKRQMSGRRFSAELEVDSVAEWRGNDLYGPLIVLHTSCRFWDEQGGNCYAEVKIAVTSPQDISADPPSSQGVTRFVETVTKLPPSQRRGALLDLVTAQFRKALLMGDGESIPVDSNYFDLGLSSLRVLEIRQSLEAQLACAIDASALFNRTTISQLVEYLARECRADLFDLGEYTPTEQPAAVHHQPFVQMMINDLYEA